MNSIVYIPIEKKTRELIPKSLVATELLTRGINVVIGFSRGVLGNSVLFPSGIYYMKGLNKIQSNYMKNLVNSNHLLVVTDEEALGASDDDFMMQDCWPEARHYVSKVLCQGVGQRNALEKIRGYSNDQLSITGNTRIDLLREPFTKNSVEKAYEIKKKMGSFILINSDLGMVNSQDFDLNVYRKLLLETGWIRVNSPDDEALFADHVQHDLNNKNAIEKFVLEMGRRAPHRNLVLRPHPSEDPEYWNSLGARASNLTVATETEPIPWMLACDCLVHTGCTTGVEAAVLGVPSLGLVLDSEHLKHPKVRLANKLNPVFHNVNDAIEFVSNLPVKHSIHNPVLKSDLMRDVAPYFDIDEGRWAHEKIADSISTLIDDIDVSTGVQLNPIEGHVDAALKKAVNRSVFNDGFFDLGELEKAIFDVSDKLSREREFEVVDLNWGVYWLRPNHA